MATSTLPFGGPTNGRNCYAPPAFLGVPIKGEKNQIWLHQPCLLGSLQMGGIAAPSLRSRGSPNERREI